MLKFIPSAWNFSTHTTGPEPPFEVSDGSGVGKNSTHRTASLLTSIESQGVECPTPLGVSHLLDRLAEFTRSCCAPVNGLSWGKRTDSNQSRGEGHRWPGKFTQPSASGDPTHPAHVVDLSLQPLRGQHLLHDLKIQANKEPQGGKTVPGPRDHLPG